MIPVFVPAFTPQTGGQIGISAPTIAGGNSTFNSSTLVTTASIPAGALIIVFCESQNAGVGTTGVIDAGHNTYSVGQQSVPAANIFSADLFYVSNCAAVPSGTTFTATGTGGGFFFVNVIYYIRGANGGRDIHVTVNGTSTGSTSLSLASGVLATNNEIIVTSLTASANITNFNTGAPFTPMAAGAFSSYVIVASTASVTWHPTWTPGTRYAASMVSFRAG